MNMTKAEVLSQIKKAEEDARSMISEANEAKAKKMRDAKVQGRELINTSQTESAKKGEQKIAKAKEEIKSEKDKIIREGLADAESIKTEANKNIAKATEYLVEQFERSIHA